METSQETETLFEPAKTTPQEASDNIERAKMYEIEPDNYVEMRDELEPMVKAYEIAPKNLGEVSRNWMTKSEQHRSLATAVDENKQTDIEKMSYFEKQYELFAQEISDKPSMNEELMELNIRFMDDPENISDSDREKRNDLNMMIQQMQTEDFGLDGTIEKLPAKAAGLITEIGRSFSRDWDIIASSTAAGAGAGFLGTLAVPVVGARIAGTTAGATQGLSLGILAAGFSDGYRTMRAGTYNELSYAKGEDGKDLNLDEESKKNISTGVGIVGGVAAGVTGFLLAKTNPNIARFASPKIAAEILTRPALRAQMNILGYIAKSAGTGSAAGVALELSKIVGTELGKTDDIGEAIKNSLNGKTLDRLIDAGLIGGATAASFAGLLGLVGYKPLVKSYKKNLKVTPTGDGPTTSNQIGDGVTPLPPEPKSTQTGPLIKSSEVLIAQDKFTKASNAIKTTNTKKLNYGEMSAFKKQVFASAGLTKNVFLHMEDLERFATSPERIEIVSKMVDESGRLGNYVELLGDTPLGVDPALFTDYMDEFPELSQYMRLNPDGPNPNEAVPYLERMAETREKGAEILQTLGVEENMTPEQEGKLSEILSPSTESRKVFDEYSYYDQPTFSPMLEEGTTSKGNPVIPMKEMEEYNTAQVDARLAVAQTLKAEVERVFRIKSEKIYQDIDQEQIKVELDKYKEPLTIVNNFEAKNVKHDFIKELKANHKKPNRPAYAIDPKYLPEDLREAYVTEPRLKKRKVFVEGGMTPDEAANMLGVYNGKKLLKILANTPTEKEILAGRKQSQIDLKNQIEQSFMEDKLVSIDKAFDQQSKAHLREMKFMKDNRWSQTKKGIKRIAKPLPRIEEIKQFAETTVNKLPINQLNANQYAVGERKAQKKAVDFILNNNVEEAFKAKERAIYANEMTREVLKAKRQVDKVAKRIKRLKSKSSQAALKEAGYLEAYNDVVQTFRLETNNQGRSELKGYQDFIKEQVQNGNVAIEIPDRLMDVRTNSDELTVEQYKALGDYLSNLEHQAKFKNKLFKKHEKLGEIQTIERIAESINESLMKHPAYDPEKHKRVDAITYIEKTKKQVNTGLSMFTSFKNIVAELDKELLNGPFQQLMGEPVKNAYNNKRMEVTQVADWNKKTIESYGVDKWNDANNTLLKIDEFDGVESLKNGYVTKIQLMQVMAYLGSEDGISRIVNFKNTKQESISLDTLKLVLDRELDESDAAFMQNYFLNRFKKYGDRVKTLQERTSGVEVNLVKSVPIVHGGKVLDGGYYPFEYQWIDEGTRIQKLLDSTQRQFQESDFNPFSKGEGQFFARLRAAEMTDQGHTKNRTGSDRPLTINPDPFHHEEQVIHDLNFREVGIDMLKIIKNPIVVRDIKNVIGNEKFSVMIDSIKDIISKDSETSGPLHKAQNNAFSRFVQHLHSLHAIKAIGFKVGSALIQVDSLKNLPVRFGPKTANYLASSAINISSNLDQFDQFVEIASTINPDIGFEMDGIDDTITKNQMEYTPSSGMFFKKHAGQKRFTWWADSREKFVDTAFIMVRQMDKLNRLVATMAIAEQFTNGDIEGFPLEVIEKMSNEEQAKTMRSVVQQALDLTLTATSTADKAALQKIPVADIFVRYWNDRRAILNSTMSSTRRIGADFRESREEFKKGNKKRSYEKAKQGSTKLVTLGLASGISKMWIDIIRGEDAPLIEEARKIKNATQFRNFLGQTVGYFVSAPVTETISMIPFADSVKYAVTNKYGGDYRNVSLPILDVLIDFSTLGKAMTQQLEDAVRSVSRGKIPRTRNLSKTQKKALLASLGHMAGGLPTNALYSYAGGIEDAVNSNRTARRWIKDFNRSVKSYIDTFGEDPEAQPFINDLQDFQKSLPQDPEYAVKLLPEDYKDTMKTVLSGDDWKKVDSQTGAAGIYQFTEEKWNELMTLAPDLGLTENGRVSKDSSQQEMAFQYEIEQAAELLTSYELPVNEENLLGAHKFGLENYVNILASDPKATLQSVLGKGEANKPEFKDFKIVQSVRNYLKKQIN